LTNMQFPPPPGYVPQRICAFSGGLAGPGCAHVMIEYFPPDQLPRPPCLAHSGASVVRPETEPEKAELGPAINLPAHFANWVAGERLQLQPPLASSNSPPARISLASPEPNIAILRDPDIPQELATLELRAIVDPPRSDIVFWIDGAPYRTASPPYSIRWPLQPGQHTIQAKHPASGAASSKIRISVL